jgi:hypothetical protein
MLQTLRLYWDILWRRRQPGDLPYSPALCLLTASALIAIGIVLSQITESLLPAADKPQDPVLPAPLVLPLIVLFGAIGYSLILRAFRQSPRLIQMLTAMFGVTLFIGPAESLLMLIGPLTGLVPKALQGVSAMVLIALLIYDVYIKGWILGKTIERPVPLAVLMVLSLELLSALVAALLLGVKFGAAAAAA